MSYLNDIDRIVKRDRYFYSCNRWEDKVINHETNEREYGQMSLLKEAHIMNTFDIKAIDHNVLDRKNNEIKGVLCKKKAFQ